MIHYHGLPITPNEVCVKAMTGRHAMCSFANPEQLSIVAEVCQSVVLDNGAFTAWTQGTKFDADGYLDWAKTWLRHPAVEWCLIPDVIDGSESDNAKWVRDWPLQNSVPVWHLHESFDYLQWLMSRFERIALGSSGQWQTPGTDLWWQRMSAVMDFVCDEEGMPKVKLHGLRMLDPVVYSHLPLSSADSTNMARNIGLDDKWKGTYAPKSKDVRAMILMDRIESHASAWRWNRESSGVQQNLSLFG